MAKKRIGASEGTVEVEINSRVALEKALVAYQMKLLI